MKLLVTACLLLLAHVSLSAQGIVPIFDQDMVDCENKYILFAPDPDSTYAISYIYIDRDAGFTARYVRTIGISATGVAYTVPSPLDTFKTEVSIRLDLQRTPKVALLPEGMRSQLKLAVEPEWMSVYKDDDPYMDAAKRSYRYNADGFSQQAYRVLEPYMSAPPVDNALFMFELLFTYNALRMFDEANELIPVALEKHPKNIEIIKEVGYTMMNLEKFDSAIILFKGALPLCDTTKQHRVYQAELSANIAAMYRQQGDMAMYVEWLDKAKAVVPPDTPEGRRLLGR